MKYAISVAALLFAACSGETTAPATPAPRKVVKRTVVGNPVSLEGKKIKETDKVGGDFLESCAIDSSAAGPKASGLHQEFKSKEGINFTMGFKESPGGLRSSMRVLDSKKRKVFGYMHEMKGAKEVTFTVPAGLLHPGRYVVTGYWGDNVACELPISVK